LIPGLDENKVFITSRGQIEERLDPHYSQPKYQALLGQLARFDLVKIHQASTRIFSGMTPLSGGEAYAADSSGIPFVRSGDFDHDGRIDFASLVHLKTETHQKLMRGSHLKKGDVLFAIVGATIGKVSHYSYECEANINQAVCAVRLKPEFDPEYVSAFFQTAIGQQLIERTKRPVARANINLDEIGKLVFPRTDTSTQDKVLQLLQDGYRNRQAKLDQATALLTSIDEYLLTELGITIPPKPQNTIASRIFTAQRNDLAGWRLDPLFHSFRLWHSIEEASVPKKKLGLCCHYLKTGFAAGSNMQLFDDHGVIQLRPTNIDASRELVFERNVYLDKSVLTDRPGDVVRTGEVIFNNTNSQELVGKTAYVDIDGQPLVCSNHMTRIAVIKKELDPEYLTALLNTYQRLKVFFSLCTNWNNQSGVNVDLLRQLPIPLPEKRKQAEIAEHIRAIRREAKGLRQSAESELDAAKRRIESILLGRVAA